MEELSDDRLEVILRLHQILEDFQEVSSELRDVLAIMTSWDESGVIAASPLGRPHEESLKHHIREWLQGTFGTKEEGHSELSRTFITRGEAVHVSAWHVMDDFWQVATYSAAPGQGGADDTGEGEMTAVAFLRVNPGTEAPSAGGRDRGGDGGDRRSAPEGDWPHYRQGRDEYGEVHSAGMPPEAHGIEVEDLVNLHEDIEVMQRIAGLLLEKGAPPVAGDWQHGWASVELDPDGWLWISYRPR